MCGYGHVCVVRTCVCGDGHVCDDGHVCVMVDICV